MIGTVSDPAASLMQEATARVAQLVALPMPRLAVDSMDNKTLRSTLTQQLQVTVQELDRRDPAGLSPHRAIIQGLIRQWWGIVGVR